MMATKAKVKKELQKAQQKAFDASLQLRNLLIEHALKNDKGTVTIGLHEDVVSPVDQERVLDAFFYNLLDLGPTDTLNVIAAYLNAADAASMVRVAEGNVEWQAREAKEATEVAKAAA
jgi:hypothetical protein